MSTLISNLDIFMILHEGIQKITPINTDDLVFGLDFVKNTSLTSEENYTNLVNSFPYFMYTRIFPFIKYNLKTVRDFIYLRLKYLDQICYYRIDLKTFKSKCPSKKEDLTISEKELGDLHKVLTHVKNNETYITQVILN